MNGKAIPFSISLHDTITDSFIWKEALFLREWQWACYPNYEQYANIVKLSDKLEQIKMLFDNKPIKIVSWLRPPQYNEAIGGAKFSAHMTGEAVDFQIPGLKASFVRKKLEGKVQDLNIRLEVMPDEYNWIHVDIRTPENGVRLFKPHK